MPGIVGIFSSTEEEHLDDRIDQMLGPMCRQPFYRVQKCAAPCARMGSITLDGEKRIVEQNGVLLGCAGEIHETDKLRDKLLAAGDGKAIHYDLGEMLLALYFNFGHTALCGLNGLYTILIWERDSQKLTIINDRYGFKKLYYWHRNGCLSVASELKAITALPDFASRISEVGLFDFLAVGHPLEDRTLLDDVKWLPGASVLILQNGKLTRQVYWDYEFYNPGDSVQKEADYLDGMAYWMRKAVQRRLKENTCILLTGGLDSRILAGMFHQCSNGMKLLTSTIGNENCQDVKFAQDIARNLDYEHVRIPIHSTYIADYGLEGVRRTEGYMGVHAHWILAAESILKDSRVDYVTTGSLGNGLSGRNWSRIPGLIDETDEERALSLMLNRKTWKFDLAEKLLKPSILKNVKGETAGSIRRCFYRANTENFLSKYDYIWARETMRPFAICDDLLGEYTRVLVPFADQDLFDFVFRIPPSLRVNGKLYKNMILKHLPLVASVSNQQEGVSLKMAVLCEQNKTIEFLHRVQRRLQRQFMRKSSDKLDKFCVRYNEWLRTGSKDFIVQVLDQTELLEDYFDIDAVKDLVEDHMEGGKTPFKVVSKLVTFTLWRQLFCHK